MHCLSYAGPLTEVFAKFAGLDYFKSPPSMCLLVQRCFPPFQTHSRNFPRSDLHKPSRAAKKSDLILSVPAKGTE